MKMIKFLLSVIPVVALFRGSFASSSHHIDASTEHHPQHSLRALKQSNGGYDEGMKDGQKAANFAWRKQFDRDCYSIVSFENWAEDEIHESKVRYNDATNWQEKFYEKGYRDGVARMLFHHQQECYKPTYCDDLGDNVAASIAGTFCLPKILGASKYPNPKKTCRDASIAKCESSIVSEVTKLANDKVAGCAAVKNDPDNLTWRQLKRLQSKCTQQVDDILGL